MNLFLILFQAKIVKKPKSKKCKMDKDPDTVSLHGSSDIDGNIEKLINSSSESESSSSEDELDIQKLRSELLEDDEVGPPVGPPVSKDLAELFQKLKESGLSKETVASKVKKYSKQGKSGNLEWNNHYKRKKC